MNKKFSKILVTGGAGLIGSHIVDQICEGDLLEENHEIIVLDNFVRGRRSNLKDAIDKANISIVEGDIRDKKLMSDVTANVDIIFHQAAIRITQCAEEPRLALEVLVDGTFNVLEAAVNSNVKKVIAASSASVYGMADTFPTFESHHHYGNRTLYGAAKSFNEGLLKSFYEMYKLDYVSLRYFNVYGPRMDIWGLYTEVLIRWIELIEAGKPPQIHGDGKTTMDFVYCNDVARANILAALSDSTDVVYNIAQGKEISLNQLLNMLLEVMDSDLSPIYVPARKVNSVSRRLAEVSKAKAEIGFKAEVSLEEGLARLVNWWRSEKNN